MAPGADILYLGAPNNYKDLDAIMNEVVDNHLADHRDELVRVLQRGPPTGLR